MQFQRLRLMRRQAGCLSPYQEPRDEDSSALLQPRPALGQFRSQEHHQASAVTEDTHADVALEKSHQPHTQPHPCLRVQRETERQAAAGRCSSPPSALQCTGHRKVRGQDREDKTVGSQVQ